GTVLTGKRVGVEPEHLTLDQLVQVCLDGLAAREPGQHVRLEGGTEDARQVDDLAQLGGKGVEPGGYQRLEGDGSGMRVEVECRITQHMSTPVAHSDDALVEEGADGL